MINVKRELQCILYQFKKMLKHKYNELDQIFCGAFILVYQGLLLNLILFI